MSDRTPAHSLSQPPSVSSVDLGVLLGGIRDRKHAEDLGRKTGLWIVRDAPRGDRQPRALGFILELRALVTL